MVEKLRRVFSPLYQQVGKWFEFRASINFKIQEVPDFLSLRFGSPTGKSGKSQFFFVLRQSALV